jgi:hypothetical protein
MEPPVLTNKNQFPTEEIIFSHIGKNKSLWNSVFNYIHSSFPELKEQWNYYNDGKSWLMKISLKTKTICWVSVIKNTFRMTFYLNNKAEQAVMSSSIPDELKKQYQAGRKTKKINGLTLIFKTKKDVETAKSLIAVKLSVK